MVLNMNVGIGSRGFWLFPLLVAAVLLIYFASRPEPDSSIVAGVTNADRPPNILFIIIDDMGYNDLGANGNASVRTPNLDQLASEGVRFTRNYVNSSCTVTRAGILLGVQPEAHGFRPDAIGISPEAITLPETLREAGYSTHLIGKWHVGFLSKLAWPTRQGFDTFFGFLAQNLLRGTRDGKWLIRHPTYRDPWLQHNEHEPSKYPGHLSDILTERAVSTIQTLAKEEQPWFLTLWTYAPHAPIDPAERFSKTYPDTPAGKYLALIDQVDHSVGRVLDTLRQSGLDDNTVVMVVSDNGGTNKEVDNNLPFFGQKATFYEGGIRTPLIIRWPGEVQPGTVADEVVTYLDYFPTFADIAQIEPPADLRGISIFDILNKKVERSNNVYWEASNSIRHSWSILSSDGRWRLGQYFFGEPQLNDLFEYPNGDTDVVERYPVMTSGLREDFMQWRLKARQVDFTYHQLTSTGAAKIGGHSLQRAPGYGGHTFAIALVPETPAAEGVSVSGVGRQFIAFQRDMWKLSLYDSKLHLDINGIRLEAPAPPSGICTSVIVTSQFNPGHVMPKKKSSLVELYVNGEKAAEFSAKSFKDPVDAYINSTFIGQNDEGAGHYVGTLGKPLIINERLVADGQDNGKIDNSISSIEKALCAQLEAVEP